MQAVFSGTLDESLKVVEDERHLREIERSARYPNQGAGQLIDLEFQNNFVIT